ncbi:RING-H2 finger protein ATL1 [Fagus crenata]
MDDLGSPSHNSGSFFTPLLISLAGIITSSLVIVAYHLILVRYCLWRRRQQQLNNRYLQQIPGGQSKGLDQKILDTIPILSFSTKKGKDQIECVVCLGELGEGDMVRLLPNCRHEFHVPCIDKWFMEHSNCPVCRSPIVAPIITPPVVPLAIEVESVNVAQSSPQGGDDHDHDDAGSGDVGVASTSRVQVESGGSLRHCVSLVLPMEGKQRGMITGLKRSVSLDQSCIIINIQRECDKESSSSSSSSSSCSTKDVLTQNRTYSAKSATQIDCMSRMLFRSFSQLRLGRGSSRDIGILPY